jgi:hypothetical protein
VIGYLLLIEDESVSDGLLIERFGVLLLKKPAWGQLFRRYTFHWVFGSFMLEKAMTPNDSIAIILFLLYCLAVHVIHLERHKQRWWSHRAALYVAKAA